MGGCIVHRFFLSFAGAEMRWPSSQRRHIEKQSINSKLSKITNWYLGSIQRVSDAESKKDVHLKNLPAIPTISCLPASNKIIRRGNPIYAI